MTVRNTAWGWVAFVIATLPIAHAASPAAVDDARLTAAASSDQWLTIGRDYAETRFSPLTQINSQNVKRLGLAWSYDTRSLRGLEATPRVADPLPPNCSTVPPSSPGAAPCVMGWPRSMAGRSRTCAMRYRRPTT